MAGEVSPRHKLGRTTVERMAFGFGARSSYLIWLRDIITRTPWDGGEGGGNGNGNGNQSPARTGSLRVNKIFLCGNDELISEGENVNEGRLRLACYGICVETKDVRKLD